MITWCKLRNGAWGLRGPEAELSGTVSVAKRDGSRTVAQVGRIVARFGDRTKEHVAALHEIDGETLRLALATVAGYPETAETVWSLVEIARRLGAVIETRAQIQRIAAAQRQALMHPEAEAAP